MGKHTLVSKIKKKTKKVFENKTTGIAPNEIVKEPSEPFDFGGLPIQDLKKNLGCG